MSVTNLFFAYFCPKIAPNPVANFFAMMSSYSQHSHKVGWEQGNQSAYDRFGHNIDGALAFDVGRL